MSGTAAKIVLTEKQHQVLTKIKRSAICPQRLIVRATIILLAFEGLLNSQISVVVGLGRHQVGLWRRRWQHSFKALIEIEHNEFGAEFRRTIEDVLSDAPRKGCAKKFTSEQVPQSMAVACEPPEKSNRPIGNWSHRELAAEITARGIVDSISKSHLGNLLNQMDLQPHKSRYWLNTKEKTPVFLHKKSSLSAKHTFKLQGDFTLKIPVPFRLTRSVVFKLWSELLLRVRCVLVSQNELSSSTNDTARYV